MKLYTKDEDGGNFRAREEWLDVIKAIAIVAIVFSHAGVSTSPFSYFYVPIFFFASGYVFADKGIVAFILRLLKRIYLPFVGANVIVLLFHNILYSLGVWSYEITGNDLVNDIFDILKFNIIENIMAACWFLVALFFVNLCFYIIYRVFKNLLGYQWLIWAVTMLLGVGSIVFYEIIPQVLYGNCSIVKVSLVGLMFFSTGWIAKECKIINIVKSIKPQMAIGFATIILLLIKYTFYGNKFDYRAMEFSNWALIIPTSFGGIVVIVVFIMGLLEIKSLKQIMSALAYIGKHTMPILLFHTMAFQIVSVFQMYVLNIPPSEMTSWCHIYNEGYWAFLIGICGIVAPLFIQRALLKPFIKL